MLTDQNKKKMAHRQSKGVGRGFGPAGGITILLTPANKPISRFLKSILYWLNCRYRGSHDWILVSDERDKKEWVCSICSKSNVVQTIIGLAHQINKPDYKIMDDMNKTNEILMDAVEVT